MARFFPIALLALAAFVGVAPAGGKEQVVLKVEDKLTKDDPKDKVRNAASKVHVLKMKSGQVYTIDMVGNMFDAFLRLEDKAGTQLEQDDDSGGNLNAKIVFNCTKDGDYNIICTCFSDAAGAYTLTVKQGALVAKFVSSLIDKAAPDFQGEFALNGPANRKLSDLKGKVVLLHFWTVRSESSLAAFPRFREWNKAYKKDGLEIVGLTYYQHEIGHKLGFDKENGVLTDIALADDKTEQTMLRDFAAYHKLEHLLLTQPQSEALKTFDAYAVNHLPLIVLIDRQGMVRVMRTGLDAAAAAALEGEIKGLLAKKGSP